MNYLGVPIWDGSDPNCSKSCTFAQVGGFARCLASEIIVEINDAVRAQNQLRGRIMSLMLRRVAVVLAATVTVAKNAGASRIPMLTV